MSSQNIIRRSATSDLTPAPQVRDHQMEVAKLIDVSICIGCKACQVACNEWNDLRGEVEENVGVYDNPRDLGPETWTLMRFTEHEDESGKLEWLIRKDGCMHCEDPGCLKACPIPGAIVQYANGIVDFQSDLCVGCGYCVAGCPFDVPRISKNDNKAYKCTLCSDRVMVGQAPACAKTCPTGAIAFGSKAEMQDLAASRVEELNERGYSEAGLYDPQGVGGTHVMYVLQHANDPTRYAKLPEEPTISPIVETWKDTLKPAAAIAGGLAAAGMLAHFIGVGPNSTDEGAEDEQGHTPSGQGGGLSGSDALTGQGGGGCGGPTADVQARVSCSVSGIPDQIASSQTDVDSSSTTQFVDLSRLRAAPSANTKPSSTGEGAHHE